MRKRTFGSGYRSKFLKTLMLSVLTRIFEWGIALISLLIGLGLLYAGDTFGASPNYTGLDQVGHENFWGAYLTFCGISTIICLLVNGAQPNTTGTIRSILAILRSMFWALTCWSFILAAYTLHVYIISIPTYAMFVIMELAVVVRSTWDRANDPT